MSRAARYADAIHSRTHLTIPGAALSQLVSFLGFCALVVIGTLMALGHDEWWGHIVGAFVALGCGGAAYFQGRTLIRVGRAYRLSPEGLSYETLPPIPWAELRGAYRIVDSGGPEGTTKANVVLSVTAAGLELARSNGFGGWIRITSNGIELQRFRGCSVEVTCRLLTEAIVVNRRRLGLAPIL